MTRLAEQRTWDVLKKHLVGRAVKMHRVESLTSTGIPDLIGINRQGVVFWIEMKAIGNWPAKDNTVPLYGRFQPGQISFMMQWEQWEGHAFVLLRVGIKEWLLFSPDEAVVSTKEELVSRSHACGLEEIIQFLENME